MFLQKLSSAYIYSIKLFYTSYVYIHVVAVRTAVHVLSIYTITSRLVSQFINN